MKWMLSALVFLPGLCSVTHCAPHQFHFVGTPLPWLSARAFCRERYADLATILDVEDMNRLVNTAQEATGGFTGMAWIGLHDNLTSWRWSFPDSRYYGDKGWDYRNWDSGQPDNFLGDQMCVKMWNEGVWDDFWCFLRNPFICYDGMTNASQRFVLVEEELSWFDAQLHCRERYTDLASIRNEKENQEIQRLARYRSVWIGLNRTREWSDQSDSTFRYWKRGEPDNVGGKQNCTAADLGNAGLWWDEQCSRELVFICYGEQEETPHNSSTTTIAQDKGTTTEAESNAGHVTTDIMLNHQSSTIVDLTRAITKHVIMLGVKLTSKVQLSEDDVRELVLVQFRNLLIEMGLSTSIKVGLKTPLT